MRHAPRGPSGHIRHITGSPQATRRRTDTRETQHTGPMHHAQYRIQQSRLACDLQRCSLTRARARKPGKHTTSYTALYIMIIIGAGAQSSGSSNTTTTAFWFISTGVHGYGLHRRERTADNLRGASPHHYASKGDNRIGSSTAAAGGAWEERRRLGGSLAASPHRPPHRPPLRPPHRPSLRPRSPLARAGAPRSSCSAGARGRP